MGELKALREQQETLVNRAKEVNRKLWLAGLGAVTRVEEEGRARLDQFVAAGRKQQGEDAAGNEYVLAAIGAVATLRDEGQKLFDDLVAAGEKREGKQA